MDAQQQYQPIDRGGERLIMAFIAAAWILWIISIVGGFVWQAVFGGAVAALIMFLFTLTLKQADAEPFSFRQYIKRNILGYYRLFSWSGETAGRDVIGGKQLVNITENDPLFVERKKLQTVLSMEPSSTLTVAIPLGGWFVKPAIVCDWWPSTRTNGIRVEPRHKRYRAPDNPAQPSLWLEDRQGNVLAVDSVDEIAQLLSLGGNLADAVRSLISCRRALGGSSERLRRSLELLSQTTERIAQTKRFQHSKEGKAIRVWLEERLSSLKTD